MSQRETKEKKIMTVKHAPKQNDEKNRMFKKRLNKRKKMNGK